MTQKQISVVIPCLDESETVGACVAKALAALGAHGAPGEVIVADNGSTDGSQQVAASHGARVVSVPERGYGSALMAGIAAAEGEWIIMGDADDSYDFREIPRFIAALEAGCDIAQGCRLPSGGGTVLPGSMPLLHRWWGNPMFSWLARGWFGVPLHDVNCGMRGFRRDLYTRLDQRCTGMEFATEMVVKAAMLGARIVEVPITLHPDGRVQQQPHLRTFRDGWRTLRFLLMYSPRWLFGIPGGLLIAVGVLGYALALPGVTIGSVRLDVHTLLYSSMAIICGLQAVHFGVLAKVFAMTEGLVPESRRLTRLLREVNLERGLVIGLIVTFAGGVLLSLVVIEWASVEFGDLDYARTLRRAMPGAMLVVVGFQAILASFFLGLLRLKRR